jgi:CRISPR system Cascade subunit CasE
VNTNTVLDQKKSPSQLGQIFISSFSLDDSDPKHRSAINDIYKLHQLVMSVFPDSINREQSNILFRAVNQDDGSWSVIVRSTIAPSRPILSVENWRSKGFEAFFPIGQVYAFDLLANAVRSEPAGGNKRGRMVGIVKPEEQLEWLQQRSQRHGFEIEQATVLESKVIRSNHKNIVLSTARFVGTLKALDPALLLEAYSKGVGRAKAFGCGMLSLRR